VERRSGCVYTGSYCTAGSLSATRDCCITGSSSSEGGRGYQRRKDLRRRDSNDLVVYNLKFVEEGDAVKESNPLPNVKASAVDSKKNLRVYGRTTKPTSLSRNQHWKNIRRKRNKTRSSRLLCLHVLALLV
jgi:hypothetical protein